MENHNVVVVTGAGISVESGIQPFRGKDGIWEIDPMEMATYRKFISEPKVFLNWYYQRFKTCFKALPNSAHKILASKGIRVITQNVDALHRQANHDSQKLIEIHGCLYEKRKVNAESRNEIIKADWEKINENDLDNSLCTLFKIPKTVIVNEKKSFRPHVLLFDEIYSELYEVEKAIQWVLEAETIIFMGTSNSVGITEGLLEIGLRKQKELIVVDPDPSPSFNYPGVRAIKEIASSFCKEYFR